MSTLQRFLKAALVLGIAACCPVLATSCIAEPDEALPIDCPPMDDVVFKDVSAVLENRCGTLDCHGSPYRPFRVYGSRGLRRPETPETLAEGTFDEYYTGGLATTKAERQDNALSLCGLEPEKLKEYQAAVAQNKDKREDLAGDMLTVIRKARLEERHKGGQIWPKNATGDQCLYTWLAMPPAGPDAGVATIPACAQAR